MEVETRSRGGVRHNQGTKTKGGRKKEEEHKKCLKRQETLREWGCVERSKTGSNKKKWEVELDDKRVGQSLVFHGYHGSTKKWMFWRNKKRVKLQICCMWRNVLHEILITFPCIESPDEKSPHGYTLCSLNNLISSQQAPQYGTNLINSTCSFLRADCRMKRQTEWQPRTYVN